MSNCSAAEIEEKRRIALAKLQAKKAAMNAIKTSVPTTNQTTTNNASAFINALNALKDGRKFPSYSKDNARASAHPYNRPQTYQQQQSTNFTTKKYANFSSGTQNSNAGGKTKLAPVFVYSTTCSIYMISPERFAVQTSGFHSKLIELFKTIPSKSYDAKTRIWNFSLKDYEMLIERVNGMKPDVVIGNIPTKVLKLCRAAEKVLEPSCLASIEPKLADKLLPFQQEGVCFAISQNGSIMICDEMGLGKTYQALAVADFYREDWPLLICTTASTRDSWSSHIRTLLTSVPVQYVDVLISGDQYIGDAKILIVSYTMLATHIDRLVERNFGFLIFDESHQLKNAKAKCSKAADLLARKAKHVILLSGTPALSRPLELFTQLQLIDKKFMTFMEFTTRYCDGKQSNFGWDASGQSNLQELNVILKLKFMIRRTKADVMPDMAEKSRETVVLDPSLLWSGDDVKATLNKLATDLNASRGKEKEEILLNFYSQTAAVKTKAVCSYLKTLVKEKVKFIVFAHHRVMLDAISESLCKLKVNFIRIDGSTRSESRAAYIKQFQNDTSCKVAVLSLKACNSGITLTAAEMIVFAELDWNPSTLAQAESRAHRIGQEKPVICRYLMANKTADDVIWNMLKNKQDVLNRAGLFCENLQEATETAAPTISNKIDRYFSPDKSRSNNNSPATSPESTTQSSLDMPPAMPSSSSSKPSSSKSLAHTLPVISNIKESTVQSSSKVSPAIPSSSSSKPSSSKSLAHTLPVTSNVKDLGKDSENIDDLFEDDDIFNDIPF